MPSEVCRVGIRVGVLLLEEEALQLACALEVGDDDALDRHRGAGDRRARAVALDVVDEDGCGIIVDDRALPWPSVTFALVTFVTLTKKISSGFGRRVAVDEDVNV